MKRREFVKSVARSSAAAYVGATVGPKLLAAGGRKPNIVFFITDDQDKNTINALGGPNQWNRSMEHPRVSGEGLLDGRPAVMPERETVLERIAEKGLGKQAAGYTWLDDSVGAILNKLDELGLADNTLFVFITDHGSDFKASLYDRNGTNVPCIIRWPEQIEAGAVCDELIQNIDFVPTFFDVAEAQAPRSYQLDGISLRPLFGGSGVKRRDHLYFEMGVALFTAEAT